MRKAAKIFAGVAALAAIGLTATIAADSALDIRAIAGVYKHRFLNSDAEGNGYESEDTLTIMRRSRTRAYFHVHLEFRNGHSCEAAGIAERRGASLVYEETTSFGNQCVLSLTRTGGKLVFGDKDFACSMQDCGMRGSLDGATFDLAWRRRR